MRVQVFILSLMLCCNAFQWEGVLAKEAQRKPNVVILFIDDLGYGDLACLGTREYRPLISIALQPMVFVALCHTLPIRHVRQAAAR